jgi:hypothetical protein
MSLEISVAFVEKSKIHSFPSPHPAPAPAVPLCCGAKAVVEEALVGEGDGNGDDCCGLVEKLPEDEEEELSIEEMKFNVPFLFRLVVVSLRNSITPAP